MILAFWLFQCPQFYFFLMIIFLLKEKFLSLHCALLSHHQNFDSFLEFKNYDSFHFLFLLLFVVKIVLISKTFPQRLILVLGYYADSLLGRFYQNENENFWLFFQNALLERPSHLNCKRIMLETLMKLIAIQALFEKGCNFYRQSFHCSKLYQSFPPQNWAQNLRQTQEYLSF